jgi:two-component system, sensor histidine kinase and response regulator
MDNVTKRILVVDDIEENILVATTILRSVGFTVVAAQSGDAAIKLAEKRPPDLVVLDVNMPGMNGFDVCQYFKSAPELKHIPIIFLTALSESDFIVRAFEVGGVDYVIKPFRAQELLARVNAHIALKSAQDELKHQNAQLQTLNNEKNEMLGIAAHDLKNPLGAITGLADLILARKEMGLSDADIDKMCEQIQSSSTLMFEIVKNLLDINMIESGAFKIQTVPTNVRLSIENIIARYQPIAIRKNIRIHCTTPDEQILIHADPIATVQVLDNLVSNAVKYSPPHTNIWISLRKNLQGQPEYSLQSTESSPVSLLEISIKDEGPGFNDQDKSRLFQKFARLSARPTGGEPSTGLGLSIVKKLVEAMNGHIVCESEAGQGATFTISMPVAESA